jgi:hypothetical protein
MRQSIIWEARYSPGFEHLDLGIDSSGVQASGLIVLTKDSSVWRIGYRIECAASWVVREVEAVVLGAGGQSIQLKHDGHGNWSTGQGKKLPALDGCMDVDISATPFTNTLPIRRLRWEDGLAEEIQVVYLEVPSFNVSPLEQRYTCIGKKGHYTGYLYENIMSGFKAEILVDADGLVVEYPNIFKRRWPAFQIEESE